MSLLGFFTGENAARKDTAKAQAMIDEGLNKSVGDGSPTGKGSSQQWYNKANGFLDNISTATAPSMDAWKTASGVNGFGAQNQMASDFLKNSAFTASLDRALGGVTANQNARGLGNSGANAEALAHTGADMGWNAWRQQVGDFKQGADQWVNAQGAQSNLAQGENQLTTQAIMSAYGAKASAQQALAASAGQFSPLNAFASVASSVGKLAAAFV